MKRIIAAIALGAALTAGAGIRPAGARGACCYFSAKDKDVLQPAQKAFITWDPAEKVESFTVQPKFEGDAEDFGMVIPTPSRPKLDEMPRDFFKSLAVFTILEPMDLSKYKLLVPTAQSAGGEVTVASAAPRPRVKVLEAGVVGSLDYKVIQAEDAGGLFQWLKENGYSYAGDEKTLDHYIKRGWYFTTMKIDPKQMKKRDDGTYEGEVTPTRFTFTSERLVYPLKITQISVKDRTEALFYVQAPTKVDLPGDFSHRSSFLTMWSQATSFAIPEKLTRHEKDWQQFLAPWLEEFGKTLQDVRRKGHEPATLEWAKEITGDDLAVLSGEKPYNREAPEEDVKKLKTLKGHLKKGQFVTKMRKVFARDEMSEDLEFVVAKVGERPDDIEYFSILPTSPP